MGRIPVFFATTEGQTRRIAETIASVLREEGFDSEAIDLANAQPPRWLDITSAVVGASIHGSRHQREARAFVVREARHLNARPSAFFSVSLSAGSRNPSEVDAARGLASAFAQATGWTPRRSACFPGKLAYTQYGFLKRWLMRRIAQKEGAPTDTSRDFEFTNWTAVRAFAHTVAADARDMARARAAS